VLSSQPIVVPVLRAGLGFVHAAQELLPNADVGFIGVSRDEETFRPKPYVNKLPSSLAGRQCIVLDPMLATAGRWRTPANCCSSATATGTIIVVCVLAAPEGIALLKEAGPRPGDLHRRRRRTPQRPRVHRPGLGDAGDRQFGSPAAN
jgi:uracil phosphoribosyltransferase